jgi:alpha-D-xyloside xylohydrolase
MRSSIGWRRFAGTAALWAAVLLGPHDARAEGLGNYASHSTPNERTLVIIGDAGHELRITAYGDAIVRVQAIRPAQSHLADDRYEIVERHDWPGGVTIDDRASEIGITTIAGGISLVVQKRPLAIAFARGDVEVLRDGTGLDFTAAEVVQRFARATGERFVGLGHSYFGRVERLELGGASVTPRYGTVQFEQAPLVVPFYLSSRGYGVLVNTRFDTRFHMNDGAGYGFDLTNAANGARLDYFVIVAADPAGVLDRYTELTGRPRLPRLAMLGLALSDKGAPAESDAAWWQRTVLAHRAAGYPLDHMVNDNRWRAGGGTRCMSRFEWERARYPDPAAFEAWAVSEGLVTTLDFNRCIANQSDGWMPSYNIPTPTGIEFPDSAPDLSREEVRAWWWDLMFRQALDPALSYPGSALWIDEFDEMGSAPDTMLLGNGRSWREARNGWFALAARALVADGWNGSIGGERPFVWVRGMAAGAQRWATMWSGDIEPTFAEMRRQTRGMQAAGLAGFPFWGHDAGGFFADRIGAAEFEPLYQQWSMAMGSFSPYWKPHGQGHSRWPVDRAPESRGIAARYAELRYRWMPYTYSAAHVAHERGLPIARAMALVHPEEAVAWSADLQYHWGDHVVVAPSANAGDSTVDVWLPPGTWFDYWTGQSLSGGTTIAYPAPRGRIPLFVRAGAVIPMAPYAESTAFMRRDVLEVHVWRGADGSFELIEDDGVSERFASGERRTTRLVWNDSTSELSIAAAEGTYEGAPAARSLRVFVQGSPLQCARVNGTELPFASSETHALGAGGGVFALGSARGAGFGIVAGSFAVGTPVTVSLEACAALPQVRRFEAEAGTTNATPGAKPGASGGMYVGGLDAPATYVELAIDAPAAGTYDLAIGYANGRTEPAERTIATGGRSYAVFFPPLYDWHTFGTTAVQVELAAGPNAVRFETAAGQPGVADLDFVDVSLAPAPPRPFVSVDGLVSIDAEHPHALAAGAGHAFRTITYPHGYAGDGAVIATPDTGAQIEALPSPVLEYDVDFAEGGTYYVWVRGHAFGDGDRDSVHVSVDGAVPASADRLSFTDSPEWRWTSDTMDAARATIELTAGRHTIGLVMREDGTIVDRLVLSTDPAYVPEGHGPDETRAGNPPISGDGGVSADGGVAFDGGRADGGSAPPTEPGCGCAPTGSDPRAFVVVLALALVMRRRP